MKKKDKIIAQKKSNSIKSEGTLVEDLSSNQRQEEEIGLQKPKPTKNNSKSNVSQNSILASPSPKSLHDKQC